MPPFATQQLITRVLIFLSLLVIDLFMFIKLIAVIQFTGQSQMEPAVAALLGSVIGAVTTILALAGKDFFNPSE